MSLAPVWLIAHKDMKEGFGQRALMLRVALPVVLIPLLYGVLSGLVLRRVNVSPQHAGMVGRQLTLFAGMSAVLGTFLGAIIAANAIALERVSRTIESLLATPVTDRQIFAGKVLAAYLPGLAGGYGAGVLYLVSGSVAAGVPLLSFAGVAFIAKFIATMLPLVVAIEVALGVMVSARCGSIMAATQLAGLVSVPVVGAVIYLAYRAARWPTPWLFLVAVRLLALTGVLLWQGARALGREEIVARLD